VFDAITSAGESLKDAKLFSTHFPDLNDVKLIIMAGITSIYFKGEITDVVAVELINHLHDSSIPLEIIKLNVTPPE